MSPSWKFGVSTYSGHFGGESHCWWADVGGVAWIEERTLARLGWSLAELRDVLFEGDSRRRGCNTRVVVVVVVVVVIVGANRRSANDSKSPPPTSTTSLFVVVVVVVVVIQRSEHVTWKALKAIHTRRCCGSGSSGSYQFISLKAQLPQYVVTYS